MAIFLICLPLGITIGFLVGRAVSAPYLENNGYWESGSENWESIGSPNNSRIAQIVDANVYEIWVKTESEDYYYWIYGCHEDSIDCHVWIYSNNRPTEPLVNFEIPVRANDCRMLNGELLNPPGNLVECVKTFFSISEQGTTIYYALTEDGIIWVWKHSAGYMPGFAILGYYVDVTVYTVFGCLGGLFLFGLLVIALKVIEHTRSSRGK